MLAPAQQSRVSVLLYSLLLGGDLSPVSKFKGFGVY
jgi:hypothetical protein